jgi:hypothetical protein
MTFIFIHPHRLIRTGITLPSALADGKRFLSAGIGAVPGIGCIAWRIHAFCVSLRGSERSYGITIDVDKGEKWGCSNCSSRIR